MIYTYLFLLYSVVWLLYICVCVCVYILRIVVVGNLEGGRLVSGFVSVGLSCGFLRYLCILIFMLVMLCGNSSQWDWCSKVFEEMASLYRMKLNS